MLSAYSETETDGCRESGQDEERGREYEESEEGEGC